MDPPDRTPPSSPSSSRAKALGQGPPTAKPIQRFTWIKVIDALSIDGNLKIVGEIIGCWFRIQGIKVYESMTCDFSARPNITYATDIQHRINDIGNAFAKVFFGLNLLVATRNIARKDVLESEEDKKYYSDLKTQLLNSLSEKNLGAHIGYDKSALTEDSINHLSDLTLKSANTLGLCFSGCIYYAAKVFSDPPLNKIKLIHFATDFEKGVPAEVAGKQEIYLELDFVKDPNSKISSRRTPENIQLVFKNKVLGIIYQRALEKADNEIPEHFIEDVQEIINAIIEEFFLKELPITQVNILRALSPQVGTSDLEVLFTQMQTVAFSYAQECGKFITSILKGLDVNNLVEKPRENALAHLYGLQQDIEGTGKALELLGSEHKYSSSKMHLTHFDQLETGVYSIELENLIGHHEVLYIKIDAKEGYFLDLNYGLLICDASHADMLLQILSLYPPPPERREHEDDDRNYHLSITKYMQNPINMIFD